MRDSFSDPLLAPRWLHFWSVLTLAVAVVMLTLGTIVTTFDMGMADQVWPTYPWHLLLIEVQPGQVGLLVEHTHRLLGHLLGCFVLVLALGLWLQERRTWLRDLGIGGVLAMIGFLAAGFALKTTGKSGFEDALQRFQAPMDFWLRTTGAWLICLGVTVLVVRACWPWPAGGRTPPSGCAGWAPPPWPA